MSCLAEVNLLSRSFLSKISSLICWEEGRGGRKWEEGEGGEERKWEEEEGGGGEEMGGGRGEQK